jgi:type VI secretion system secreted protein Hcp
MAAAQAFLRLDGILGDSRVAGHANEIEVLSFSWGLTNAGHGPPTGGPPPSHPVMTDLSCVAQSGVASPPLFHACASGLHIRDGALSVRGGARAPRDFILITFRDLIVTGFQQTSHGSEIPSDTVTLNFATFEIKVSPSDPAGRLRPPIEAGWDLRTETNL